MFSKDLEYNISYDAILNKINFDFDKFICYDKLFNSYEEKDFLIQLKILDRLSSDNKLLEELKDLFVIYN